MDMYSVIIQLCEENGMKPSDLAREIKIGSSVFSELKNGRTKNLSVKTLKKVADYFNVPQSYFTEETKDADDTANELFRKRKILFDKSANATSEELNFILKLVDTIVKD